MAEPEEKKEDKPTQTTTELMVRNSDGVTFSSRIKDEKGRFVKKQRPLPSSKEIIRLGRNLFNSAEAGPDGKPVKGKNTRHREIFDRLYSIATMKTEDPKAFMAQIKASELLYMRYWGKPSISDEELEAMQISGVKFVLVQPPQLMHPEMKEEHREPEFISAEIVEDKK